MEPDEPLFYKYDFRAAVNDAPSKLEKAIDALSDADLFNRDEAGLIDQVVAAHRIDVPMLDLDSVKASQREVEIDVSQDPRRFIDNTSQPFLVKATELAFSVPFKGDAGAFRCRPSKYSFNPPRAKIENSVVVIRVVREDQNAEQYRKAFDDNVASIQECLNQLRQDCAGLETVLRSAATARLAVRREKRSKDRGLIDALGFGKANPQ